MLTDEEIEKAKSHGWPWDRLACALEDRLRAAQALEDAEGIDAQERARFDLERAEWVSGCLRGELADLFLLMASCARSERHTRLFGNVMAFAADCDWRATLQQFVSTRPGGLSWVVKVFSEQDAKIAEIKRENWELAREVAALRKELARGRQTA